MTSELSFKVHAVIVLCSWGHRGLDIPLQGNMKCSKCPQSSTSNNCTSHHISSGQQVGEAQMCVFVQLCTVECLQNVS